MPTVVFKALSIVSETESAAWTSSFQLGNNLLLGTNSTGKSRVIKFLIWAQNLLGAPRAASTRKLSRCLS